MTIATTNHPERIDDSILNRPSRFDVKYTFRLPDNELRREFALNWIEKITILGKGTGVAFEKKKEIATVLSEMTEGWSFAFLKELCAFPILYSKLNTDQCDLDLSLFFYVSRTTRPSVRKAPTSLWSLQTHFC